MLKNILGWIWFAIIQVLQLALMAIGWILLFVLALFGFWHMRKSPHYPYSVLAWKLEFIDKIFGNDEDGIDGARGYERDEYGKIYYGSLEPYGPEYDENKSWYYKQDPWLKRTWKWPLWLRVYWWSAWRNSVNNLRFVVRWIGGPYYKREFGYRYLQIGWNAQGFPVLFIGNKS